jgi:RNA polymerase sigma factor (sigma-70 family)
VTLLDLLTHAAMLSAQPDTTALAPLRARLFGRLRASGWTPSGALRGRSASSADSDEALLSALIHGDPGAFDTLFDHHAPKLNGYARRSLQPADADDAVQEAFLVLFNKTESVLAHKPVNIGGFLFATLHRKILHILARRSRETPSDMVDDGAASLDEDSLAALLRREDKDRLALLLTRACSPLEQQVVAMDLDDRDGPEIAKALDISLQYVRVLRHRALAKLRKVLEEEEAPS